mgnify:CR=1 FL=1
MVKNALFRFFAKKPSAVVSGKGLRIEGTMRQTVFLLFLAMGLGSFIGVNYYLNHQVELKAIAAERLATFQSDQDVERA